MKTPYYLLLIFSLSIGCQPKPIDRLNAQIEEILCPIDGHFAIAFQDLKNKERYYFLNEGESFHAASTMKVPVMIELFQQAEQGIFALEDSILIHNQFKSIVDGSDYAMDIAVDSQGDLYGSIGKNTTLYDLMYEMITSSSNLSTNILIDKIGAKNVTATMRKFGAEKIAVLRGVEDQKAFDLGLNNTTTARDFLIILESIAQKEAASPEACDKMIAILKEQKFNEIIPHFLPSDVQVAHKTGSITGLHHDGGIVYLPDDSGYVLVLFSKDLTDFDEGTNALARLSELFYAYYIADR